MFRSLLTSANQEQLHKSQLHYTPAKHQHRGLCTLISNTRPISHTLLKNVQKEKKKLGWHSLKLLLQAKIYEKWAA